MEKKSYKTFAGRLSLDLVALSKTPKGILASPIYRVDKDGNINNFFQNEGKAMELYTYRNGSEEIYEQKELTDEGQMRSLALAIDSPTQDNVQWISLQLWGDIAKDVHLNYKKGDLVSIVASKTTTKSQATGKDFDVWNVVNISKIEFERREFKNRDDKEEENRKEEAPEYGFKPVQGDDDNIPF